MSGHYILGDWGTSSARFYLCQNGAVKDCVNGPGVKFTDNVGEAFHEAVNPWVRTHGPLTSVLCGMVGSNIGWKDAGYIMCPADMVTLSEKKTKFSSRSGEVVLIPGVRTNKGLTSLPDMMRGEEVQIMGWAETHAQDALLCLPGTHTKWAIFRNGKIENFVSSLNGELFNILASHSVLINDASSHQPKINSAFHQGLEIGASDVSLNQLLFSVRSQQLSGDKSEEEAQSYLLGLLIGSDVSGVLKYSVGTPIQVIGGEAPARFYDEAIRYLGGATTVYDGQNISLTGLQRLYQAL